MTGWRDLDGVRQHLPLDDWTADRLIAGLVDPDDAPPGYAGLAQALGLARGPVEAGELAGRERIVAAVAAAVVDASPPTTISTSPRRRPMISRLLGTKVAAAAMTTVLLATGAAAATGSLPGPVQGIVSDAADNVGVNLPDGDTDSGEVLPVVGDDSDDQGDHDDADEIGDDSDDQGDHDDADEVGDDSDDSDHPATHDDGDHPATHDAGDDVVGAAHGIGKGENASETGDVAHELRDARLGVIAARQAGEDAPAGDDSQADEDHGTPASEQGVEGHARRDEQLGTVAEQKAERPADEADDSDDQGDVADDDADDDEDEGKGTIHEHDDDHGDDEAEDAPAAS